MKYLIIVLALVTTTKAHAADTAYCGDVCTSCQELCADDATCTASCEATCCEELS